MEYTYSLDKSMEAARLKSGGGGRTAYNYVELSLQI